MKNNLININDEYSFINSCKNISKRRKMLLKTFISNEYIKEFFLKERNGKTILWNKSNYMKWLKRTKTLFKMLIVLYHLLEDQSVREMEMMILRYKKNIHEQREMYWAHKSMMLLGIYFKTRSMIRRNNLIPRWDVKMKCITNETGFCRRDWGFCWWNISSWWGQ